MGKQKSIKAAVIGCGRIGAFTKRVAGEISPASEFPVNHCAAIRAAPGVELIAVCDLNLELAQKAGQSHKVKNIYTDFKKMIAEQSPDIITIATRTAERPDIIIYAANHGIKGMHIEKPLAINLADAKKAVRALQKNRVAISYGAVRRYSSVYQQTKKIIQSGRLGKLNRIIIEFGKSSLMWTHPHSVDLVNYFADNSEVAYAQSSFKFNKKDVNNKKIDLDPVLDFGLVKFKNGVSGLITDRDGRNTGLICERGEIWIMSDGRSLRLKDNNGKIRNIKIKKGLSGTITAISELRESLARKKPTSITAEEILKEQRILMALGYSGIYNSRKTALQDIDDNFTITGRTGNLYA
ncbi:MAG: Gfo/Idh/MocA family oxidoreductase [Candidatus Harrisonbacteria bacterium]|nr:Gfo/Idh/MocA family oxidoreductase [Candidatus Harrisonbacteria bacterium]